MLLLDARLAVAVIATFPILWFLTRWFRNHSETGVPRDARRDRARDRALRRKPRRDPGRARVPARAPQPRDLRPSQRPLPRREPLVTAPRGRVRTGCAVHRPHHDGGRADLRRLARHRRADERGRAGRVPPLPAPVLRAHAGAQPVLQPVPGRPPPDSRSSRASSTRSRRFPSPPNPIRLRHPRGAVRFDDVEFAYRENIVLPDLDLDIPAGQTDRARRRHRRGQDDDRPARRALLGSDHRDACCSTGSTCATSARPTCGARS